MLADYKRRQMEFQDAAWPRYNLAPIVLSSAYDAYMQRKCEVGINELTRTGLLDSQSILVCGVGGGAAIENIPFADNSVDLVIAMQVLHHTLDSGRSLREMVRVARKGVLLLEPAHSTLVPLFTQVGLARDSEIVGNTVLRFDRASIERFLHGALRITYRRYLFYDHRLIEKALNAFSHIPGSPAIVKWISSLADFCLFPLRSKCAVTVKKVL